MRWLLVALVLAACGSSGDRVCGAGSCTDPSFPYCDVDGAIAGTPHTCIAVACVPGEVASCRGDTAVVCNADGTSFDDVACTNGCEAALPGGCRLCDANRSVCADDIVETCNNAGDVVAVEHCSLGCNATVPRCNLIDPSNELGRYFDEASNAPDLVLDGAVFESDGSVVSSAGPAVDIPSFLAGGIRVFVVHSIALTNATFGHKPTVDDQPDAAIAIIARGDITVAGTLTVWPTAVGSGPACHGSAGVTDPTASSGGGGGANATDGGDGGAVLGSLDGGTKDTPTGTPDLVPLRGGCSGALDSNFYWNGGGALQLASTTKLAIDAAVDLRGQDGIAKVIFNGGIAVGGGGAGGSLLLEAATVELGPTTALLLSGGNGFHCTAANCGTAGAGATRASPATAGGSVPISTNATAGGGGGSLGRVRINTKTGSYTRSATTIEDAQVTTSTVRTR